MKQLALSHQRILLFTAANEVGGSALLYRILKRTKHPLYIYYICRYQKESSHAAHFLQQDPKFKAALTRSGSSLKPFHIPGAHCGASASYTYITEKIVEKHRKTHGEKPISYIFHNGHPTFGEQINVGETPDSRAARISKNWAPFEGALEGCAPRDKMNPFDHSIPFASTAAYVSLLNRIWISVVPWVRTDRQGKVVFQSPQQGYINAIRSKPMRQALVNPSNATLGQIIQRVRRTAADMDYQPRKGLKEEQKEQIDVDWSPDKLQYLQVCDLVAKSAITLLRRSPEFQDIAFNGIVHDPSSSGLDRAVELLLAGGFDGEGSAFTAEELAAALRDYENDTVDDGAQLSGSGIHGPPPYPAPGFKAWRYV